MRQTFQPIVHIRPDAEHKQPGFVGQPPAQFRAMGRYFADTFVVRMCDTEADCYDVKKNKAAVHKDILANKSKVVWWIEMWSEQLNDWVEI